MKLFSIFEDENGEQLEVADKQARESVTDINQTLDGLEKKIPTNYISGGSQTSTSSEDGGSNVFTFTNADGTTSEFVVKNGNKGSKGDKGEQGIQGIQGAKGDTGANGKDGTNGSNGKDGVSCTHSWSGTTLSITSASGTSSANLKGEKGDKGDNATTTSVANKNSAGLCPKLPNETTTTKYLRQDGTWVKPPNDNTTSADLMTVTSGKYGGDSDTTNLQTAVSNLSGAVDTLNSNLQWKFFKNINVNRSGTLIDLPENFNELSIYCYGYIIRIPKNQLPENYQYIQTGHYHTASNNGGFAIRANKTTLSYPTLYTNGSTDDTKTASIYYR